MVLRACIGGMSVFLFASEARLGRKVYMIPTDSSNAALIAAQAELFVLRATIPATVSLKEPLVIIAPNRVPVSAQRATEVLSRMPKPMRCAADVNVDHVLTVRCVRLSSAAEIKIHTTYLGVMEEQLRSALGKQHQDGVSAKILLQDASRPCSVPRFVRQFGLAFRTYHEPGTAVLLR